MGWGRGLLEEEEEAEGGVTAGGLAFAAYA